MFDEKSYSLKMDKAIEVFSKELSSLRTGRANAPYPKHHVKSP